MKRIIKTLYIAAAIALFVFAANEKAQGQYSGSCMREMAEETAKYVRASKISFKDGVGEFYSDQDEQIYLLSSQEKVSLNVRKPPKRVVSVIASKMKNESTVFYVVEAEFEKDSIIYSLKRNGQTVEKSVVKIVGPPWIPPPNSCKKINTQVQIQMAQMQLQANAACRPLRACFPMCKNGQIVGYMMVAFYPHNPLCPVEVDLHNELGKVFNTSLENDSALFTFTDKK